MGQSLSQLYVHLIFGTKERYPFIDPSNSDRLHVYIAGIFKKLDSPALIINSHKDHVHSLFRLSKNMALSKVIEEVKKSSSKWMKEIHAGDDKFTWQIGYAAYSVSASKVAVVEDYIANQKEHHSIKTYKEELEGFMKKYNVLAYDENYFWQ